MGTEPTLDLLKQWQPDVIYCHKLNDASLERQILGLAPSVFFAHDYNGMCISGTKSFMFPVMQPCNRRFGWPCLVHYLPNRCGGLNPITMLKLYSLQSKRLENLRAYDAIVTHSDHMLAELRKHGLSPHHAYKLPFSTQSSNGSRKHDGQMNDTSGPSFLAVEKGNQPIAPVTLGPTEELSLLFSGRMEYLKGAHMFIDALSEVAAILDRPLRAIFAGDGREREALELRAARLGNGRIRVDFVGWLEQGNLEALLKTCDLLVVPSLLPEPFGLVGPEAGHFGVPAAAFDVGGIRDWLADGVNGHLASGNPPTSKNLAHAIIKCLRDPATHARLRKGAFEMSQQFSLKNHLTVLMEVFSDVTSRQ
jgi:glycosyltransferase involved in cell wall biosynthesis